MRLVESNARAITLTPHGFAVAEDAVRKHRLAERFLTDVLKMPWHLAHPEANRFHAGAPAGTQRREGSARGEAPARPPPPPAPAHVGAEHRRALPLYV